ncbi:MAG: tetratricopeptide repeat protein [Candidatus Omnitrophica bacterium]|nr:tetratricopeptide repeat protein [Candidatus Omnitrophota bacterium]
MYDKRGFKDLALKEYLEAIRLDSQYAPAYMNLALLYRELGNRERAAFYLKERAGFGKGKSLWRNRAKQLLEEYGTSVKKTVPQVREEISKAASEELDKAEALMELSIREKLDSDEVATPGIKDHFSSAKLNYQKGAYDKALEEFKEAQRQVPDSVEIAGYTKDCEDKIYIDNLYKEGKSALGRGDFTLAISKISELLSLDPVYKNAEEILASAEKERFIQETRSKDEPIILRMP